MITTTTPQVHLRAFGGDQGSEMVALYAATGGVDFVIQTWLLARRTYRVAEAT